MISPIQFRNISLISFFSLMGSLLWWIVLTPHSPQFPTAAMLIIAVVPLLFPLRGLLHGKTYTHAWNSFLMLFYFSHGIGELYSADNFVLFPILEIVFSSLCFLASILYIRANAKLKTNSHK